MKDARMMITVSGNATISITGEETQIRVYDPKNDENLLICVNREQIAILQENAGNGADIFAEEASDESQELFNIEVNANTQAFLTECEQIGYTADQAIILLKRLSDQTSYEPDSLVRDWAGYRRGRGRHYNFQSALVFFAAAHGADDFDPEP